MPWIHQDGLQRLAGSGNESGVKIQHCLKFGGFDAAMSVASTINMTLIAVPDFQVQMS